MKQDAQARYVVELAREWVGTPYRHQASLKGAGADCLGLIRGVWRGLYDTQEPVVIPPYTPDWSEPGQDELLWRMAVKHLEAAPDDARPGDVLLFRMRYDAVAKHLGILSEAGGCPRFIHAYCGAGVVESSLTPFWHRHLVSRFRFPREV